MADKVLVGKSLSALLNYGITGKNLEADLEIRRLQAAAREYFRAIGRKGGASTSEKKAKAARRNGKKGGRPRELEMEYPATLSGRR